MCVQMMSELSFGDLGVYEGDFNETKRMILYGDEMAEVSKWRRILHQHGWNTLCSQ